MDIRELYQELIIDHGTQPRNCCKLADANGQAEGFNPLCGDKVCVYLKIENQCIQKASFEGKGCAISMASASLMTETLQGKSIEEANTLFKNFQALLMHHSEEQHLSCLNLGKLMALAGVKAYPARVKCATLAWHTLQAAILQESTPVSTET